MDSQLSNREKSLVLIVDDEITARIVTHEVLLNAGFEVEEAEDGAMALQIIDTMKPDIILTDIMMPGMDGFTLCEEIRRRPDGKLLPVLIVTGLEDVDSIHRSYEVGATDFITKPFNWLVLCQRIRHMIRERLLVEDLRQSEAKNRALLSAIPDMMLRIDTNGTILEWKDHKDFSTEDVGNQLIDRTLYEILAPNAAKKAVEAVHKTVTKGTTEYIEYQMAVNESLRDLEVRFVASGPNEALGIVRDITRRKKAEKALRESEERYAIAMEGANDGLWDWDMRTNEIHYALRWKTMLGWEDHDISRSPDEWFGRIHKEDIEQFRIFLNAHLEGVSPHFEVEHRIAHKDGTYLWVLTRGIAVRDKAGKPYRMAGSQSDITDRRRAQDQLLHNALYDPLTGLANRTLLMDRLTHALNRAKRSKLDNFALLFLDLDRFKNINDTLGHPVGDKVLIAVAQKLQSCVRPGDTVARVGGDEFVILLENITDISQSTVITERIEHTQSLPINIDGQEIFILWSIGIVIASGDYEKPDDILRDADIAVYRAKALGRGCHVIFDQSMYQRTLELLELESDLRKAIEKQEFLLHYQPIVSLDTGNLVSLEALIRWQHPKRGLVPPMEFIPLAEETGLIISIGEWVLRTACAQIVEWKKVSGSSPIVAINISGHQLKQNNFALFVKRIMNEYGLAPDHIEFEITESVLLENMEHANIVLSELKEIGLNLSIDDFGTGYSSLSYLQRFPVQKLKVDKSFIQKLGIDEGSSEIVSAVLKLAKGLGLDVVAEGVETNQAVDFLKDMGCDLAQGYFFARPTAVENLDLPCKKKCA